MNDDAKRETRGRKKLPPGRKKVRRTIAIDGQVWEDALAAFPSVSAEVERSLRRRIKARRREGAE